ncbi:MAG: glutamate--tRNA ligase [Hyphomicrobium aestuarii]|nr:glutamate--tRNA ligase [Hyphomicrobium aestuarii]
MSVAVRFAPSPTGRLHAGNIRPAVLNFMFARSHGGTFMLRLDDTDRERSKPEFADAIERDLTWLGLTWDRFARQSDRLARYQEVADQLRAMGRLYPCYETADELDRKRKRQLARGLPPIYDRAGLRLSPAERAAIEADGKRPHWRLRLDNFDSPDSASTGSAENGAMTPQPTPVAWDDLIRRHQTVDIGSLSDPVLIREDGTPLYTFTSVVDDIDFAITHVIRGEDHVTNTGVQLALFAALGATPPAFAHHSLLIGADGQALSKRLDSLSIGGFREAGFEPMAVLSHAALIGTSDAVEPRSSIEDLTRGYSLAKVSTAPARFDEAELRNVNARLLHGLAFDAVAERLTALGVAADPALARAFWEAVRGNVSVISDARRWWDVVAGDITPVIEDAAFTAKAAELLPPEPWSAETWSAWTNAIKSATGSKGKSLFHPLRLALTGLDSGPEMKPLLPLIGRARAMRRLGGLTT